MSDPQRDPSLLHEDVEDVDDRPVVVLRRSALAQDVLLFCVAFTAGAVLFLLARVLGEASLGDVWAESLSDGMLLSGLVAGELFILWNNGWRQGVRGHSIGKHREGLRVVDIRTRRPTGPWRGLARGLVMAVLLDLAVAAIPIGLPTVLRRFTPDAWHVGASAYLALIVLVVPLLMRSDRGFADRLVRTRVVEGEGVDAHTSPARRRALVVLDVVGVVGVLLVCATYLSFFWPLLWQLPDLT